MPKGLPVAMWKSQKNIYLVQQTSWGLCLFNKLQDLYGN